MKQIMIRGGRVIDPAHAIDQVTDLYIAEGRITALGMAPAGFVPDRVIDATNQVVCPGLVDLRARLREPGQTAKGTIASETRAAAHGGVTTLCCPPDTTPVIDSPAVAELIQHRAELAGFARVIPTGALTQGLKGEQISAMQALKDAGCIGVSNAFNPLVNTLVLRRAMEYVATLDMTLFLHPEDPWLANEGVAHEGPVSARMGLRGIPDCAESVAVAQVLQLVGMTGARVHFCQLSTHEAVHLISRAQFDGLPVSADVSAHHLHLTHIDLMGFNSLCHVRPPLRAERDRDALRQGLVRGVIGSICSDHQPHDADAKLAPFAQTEPGISGLETLLPLALRLVDDGVLDLPALLAKLTCQPASVLGIAAGTLEVGALADVCVFDPEQYWTLRAGEMASRGQNSPFLGLEMKGRVTHTLLGGKVVFELSA